MLVFRHVSFLSSATIARHLSEKDKLSNVVFPSGAEALNQHQLVSSMDLLGF